MSAQADTGPASDMHEPASFQLPVSPSWTILTWHLSLFAEEWAFHSPHSSPTHYENFEVSAIRHFFLVCLLFLFSLSSEPQDEALGKCHRSPQVGWGVASSWLWVAGGLVLSGGNGQDREGSGHPGACVVPAPCWYESMWNLTHVYAHRQAGISTGIRTQRLLRAITSESVMVSC